MRTIALVSILAGIAVIPLVLLAACESTQTPTLCMFTAAELSDAGADVQPGAFPCPDPADAGGVDDASAAERCVAVSDGELFFVRHTLPAGVSPQGPLVLRIRTPCEEALLDVPYTDGVASLSRVAPRGSACSLTVEAVLANSELSCATRVTGASSCTEVCGPDAGTGGSGGGP